MVWKTTMRVRARIHYRFAGREETEYECISRATVFQKFPDTVSFSLSFYRRFFATFSTPPLFPMSTISFSSSPARMRMRLVQRPRAMDTFSL